jgi:hypothetical protein
VAAARGYAGKEGPMVVVYKQRRNDAFFAETAAGFTGLG